jgi:hypothetical protein
VPLMSWTGNTMHSGKTEEKEGSSESVRVFQFLV